MQSLMLTHLSVHDFEMFDKHPFSYSGSTGAGAVTHPEWYPGAGACISTYMSELVNAIHLFGWKAVALRKREGTWFAEQQT